MTPEEIRQMIADIEALGLEGAANLYGMSVEEIKDIMPIEEYLDMKGMDSEGALDKQMQDNVNRAEEDTEGYMEYLQEGGYGINPEWEGEGIKSDVTPMDSLLSMSGEELAAYGEDNNWPAWLVGGITAIASKGKTFKKPDGMLTPKKHDKKTKFGDSKAQQRHEADKSKTKEGEVMSKRKDEELAKNKSDAIKSGTAATAATTATAIGLSGDREPDGSLKPVGKAYGGKLEGYDNEDFSTGKVEAAADTQRMMEEDWEMEQVQMEERPGWFKPKGSNFWSVDTESPYWQTDEGAAEAESVYGQRPAWAKQPERKELNLDLSTWF